MWWRQVQTQMQEMLGEGGQGCVFKALRVDRETKLSQTVAVKILHSKTAVELWTKEFESLHQVRSPYCVQVLSFERLRGRPALILEYIDGVSLTELGRTCYLSEDDLCEILAQIQQGLVDLNAQGTFHGDLSPHNVMIDRTGRVRLLDFGLANGSGRSARLTPEFAAPERLRGETANLASDLFSLGRLEQFLRGIDIQSTDGSDYLQDVPNARKLRSDLPNPQRQEQLSATVQMVLERRLQAASMHTRTQARSPAHQTSYKGIVLASIISCLFLTTSSASQSTRVPIGALTVRTNTWHYLIVDGAPVGYAPLTVALRAGIQHQLQWISAHGRGQRQLQVGRDAQIELSDRDFSH